MAKTRTSSPRDPASPETVLKASEGSTRPKTPGNVDVIVRSTGRRSGIRRKVDPQRQAECEVKRDTGCECNSGGIHSLSLISGLRSGWNLG